jgi:hypothetical protein
MHDRSHTVTTPYRSFLVNDDMIDDYVEYRRTVASNAPRHGAEPLYFHQWFDNLWQAAPVDRLVGCHE